MGEVPFIVSVLTVRGVSSFIVSALTVWGVSSFIVSNGLLK